MKINQLLRWFFTGNSSDEKKLVDHDSKQQEIDDVIERIQEEAREAMRIAMKDYKLRTEKRNKEILEAFLRSQRDGEIKDKNNMDNNLDDNQQENPDAQEVDDHQERVGVVSREAMNKAMDYAMKRYTERAEKRSQELIKAFKELEQNEE